MARVTSPGGQVACHLVVRPDGLQGRSRSRLPGCEIVAMTWHIRVLFLQLGGWMSSLQVVSAHRVRQSVIQVEFCHPLKAP